MTNEEFNKLIFEELDSIKNLFSKKQDEYAKVDPLANFNRGALLSQGQASRKAEYETLLDYCNKHIAKIYTYKGDIMNTTAEESLRDIAVYMVIALAMIKDNKNKGS